MIGPAARRLAILEYRLRMIDLRLRGIDGRTSWFEDRSRELNRPIYGDGPPACPGLACVRVVKMCFGGAAASVAVSVDIGATNVASGTTDSDGYFCFDPSGYIGQTGTITLTTPSPPAGCTYSYDPIVAVLACNTFHGTITLDSPDRQCCAACTGGWFCASDLNYSLTNAQRSRVTDAYGNCSVVWSDKTWLVGDSGWSPYFEWQCTATTIRVRRKIWPVLQCASVFNNPDTCTSSYNGPWTFLGYVIGGTVYSSPGSYPWIDADSFTCNPFSAVFTLTWYARYYNRSTLATVDCGPKTSTLTIYE